jgi:hypothetical protein
MNDPVRDHARLVLQAPLQADRHRRKRAEDLVRRGFRIVEGGCVLGSIWEFRDWTTGEVIARGDDGPAGCRATAARLDPAGIWYHADNLYDEPVDDLITHGVPASLGRAIEEWVAQPSTPDEEIAGFIGWPVDRVREHR